MVNNCPRWTIESWYSDWSFSCEVATNFDDNNNNWDSTSAYFENAEITINPWNWWGTHARQQEIISDYENQDFESRFSEIRDTFRYNDYNEVNLNWFKGSNQDLWKLYDKVKIINDTITIVLRGHFNHTVFFMKNYIEYLKNNHKDRVLNFNILDWWCSGIKYNLPEIRTQLENNWYNLLSYYWYKGTWFWYFTEFVLWKHTLKQAKEQKYIESDRTEKNFEKIKNNFNPLNQAQAY